MLSRLLSRLRRIAPANRPVKKVRPRGLNLETLEGREVPAIVFALNGSNQLVRFDTAAPTATTTVAVSGLGAGETLQGVDFRPRTGQLVGVTVPTNSAQGTNNAVKSYAINPTTGAATLIGTSAAVNGANDNSVNDIDFNPTVDRLRFASSDLGNARLNPNNGALVANDTAISPNTTQIIGLAYDRDFDRQSGTGGSTVATTLYAIDRNTGMLGTIGSVNSTTSPNGGVFNIIGGLGFTLNQTFEGGFDIAQALGAASAGNNNGLGVAYAALTSSADNLTRLYTINLSTGAATAIGLIGTGATEIYDLAVVPDSVLAVGSGAGANGDVRLLDPSTGAVRTAISNPFVGFQGGVSVATGDVNGDGVPDVVVAANGVNNGHVKVFDGTTGAQLAGTIGSFFSFQGFNGTVGVAVGDVNGDGFADVIVVASGFNANGHVKAFSGKDGSLLASFFSYQGFNGNVSVAAGDFDNNGTDEIVTAAAINGHTKVFTSAGTLFSASTLANFQSSFFAFSPYLGDVSVAVGDVNGDGTPDLLLGSGTGVPLNVRAVNGTNGAQLSSFIVNGFGTSYTGGGKVSVSDFNRDGKYELVVTPNAGTQANVLSLDPLTGAALTGGSFAAFANFQGGASVSGTRA